MTPTAPIADALLIPARHKAGASQIERIRSINRIADPLLGVDRAAGEQCFIRSQPGGMLFVTKSRDDSLYGPLNSPFRGRPRYDWIEGEGGISRGYLRGEFRGVVFEPFDPAGMGIMRPF
jgi:hypothetical protein